MCGSFFFSGSETGFVSWNPIKVGHRAAAGSIIAKWSLYLLNHKDQVLSTVLICNNLCNIGASLSFVIVFNSLDKLVPVDLGRIPSPESWILTPVMVLFGEVLPKTLFRTYPFRLTLKIIPVLLVFYFISHPFTWFFSKVLNLFRKEPPGFEESFRTKVREEMVLVALEGTKRGTLFESADVFINNVLKLKDKTISDVMIPIKEYTGRQFSLTEKQLRRGERPQLPDSDEIVIFDDKENRPVGTIAVADLVFKENSREHLKKVKPLRSIEMQKTLLAGLQFFKTNPAEIYIVEDQKQIVGILHKNSIYQEIFGNFGAE